MKVLTDVNVADNLRKHLAAALGPDVVVRRAEAEGWAAKENGELQELAKAAAYTHLLTHDKKMARQHTPHLPVLVVDNPAHGEEGREPDDMKEDEIERMTLAAAAAVADRLTRDPPIEVDYHGIAVPGYKPRAQLQRILDGRHEQHVDYAAKRHQYIGEQRAKSAAKNRGGTGR